MARARRGTPITAYYEYMQVCTHAIHSTSPGSQAVLVAVPSGANAMHVWLPNTRNDGFGPQQQGPLPS
eukprot:6045057-Prymnesium_polylepis.1